MSYRQQAEDIVQQLDQMGKDIPQMQGKFNEANLRAMIKGVNITYTNSYITNLTENKQTGDVFNIVIPSQDNVVNIPDCKFGFRLRIFDTGAASVGMLNPTMYNLPDVRSIFGTTSVTLNGKELQLTGMTKQEHRPYLTALLDRVKHREVAQNSLMNNYFNDSKGFATISQQGMTGADANDSGQLVENDDQCLTGLGKIADAAVTGAIAKKFNRGKVSSLIEHFGEEEKQGAYTANRSVQTIMKDSKKRLLQAQKHYVATQSSASTTTGSVQLPVKFKQISGTSTQPTRVDGEWQNYYEVRLGDIIPELEAFKNFYMGGNKFAINLKLLPKSNCMSKIMKPYTAEGFNQANLTLPGAADEKYDNGKFTTANEAIIQAYSQCNYQLCDVYIQVPHLLVSDSDKLAFKDIQNMIGVPLKRYQMIQDPITSGGQFTKIETLQTRNLTGIMVFFSAQIEQKEGNFVLSAGGAAGANEAIAHTDYTRNAILDGKRGLQQNHDHFALPVQEIRVVIGNNVYKNNQPPIADYSIAQYLAAMDASSLVLGDNKIYDVTLNDWMANKCCYFIPIGKGHSGLDVSDGRMVQVQVLFRKDNAAGANSDHPNNVYNRDVQDKFNLNVIYCCQDQVRFDKGYTNVE